MGIGFLCLVALVHAAGFKGEKKRLDEHEPMLLTAQDRELGRRAASWWQLREEEYSGN